MLGRFLFCAIIFLTLPFSAVSQVEVKRVHLGRTVRTEDYLAADRLGGFNLAAGDFNGDLLPDYVIEAVRDVAITSMGPWNIPPLRFYSGQSGNEFNIFRMTRPGWDLQSHTLQTIRSVGGPSKLVGVYNELFNFDAHIVGLQVGANSEAFVLENIGDPLLAVVADLSGDLVEDFAIFVPSFFSISGTLAIHSGATGQVISSAQVPEIEINGQTFFPTDIFRIGDLNSNGSDELMLFNTAGSAAVVFDPLLVGGVPGDELLGVGGPFPFLGSAWDLNAIQSTVDYNGDGRDEIVILGNTSQNFGTVNVATLSINNGVLEIQPIAQASGPSWGYLGRSLDLVADVTGDGKPEIVVGASNGVIRSIAGKAYLLDSTSLQVLRTFSSNGDAATDFGSIVKNIGDINGDGVDEIAVTASNDLSGNSPGDLIGNPQRVGNDYGAGAVYIFSAAPESFFPPPLPPTKQLAKAKKLAKSLTVARDVKKAKKTFAALVKLISQTLSSTVQSTVAGQKIFRIAGVLVPQVGKKLKIKSYKTIGKRVLKAAK